jgi:hypothetical protein
MVRLETFAQKIAAVASMVSLDFWLYFTNVMLFIIWRTSVNQWKKSLTNMDWRIVANAMTHIHNKQLNTSVVGWIALCSWPTTFSTRVPQPRNRELCLLLKDDDRRLSNRLDWKEREQNKNKSCESSIRMTWRNLLLSQPYCITRLYVAYMYCIHGESDVKITVIVHELEAMRRHHQKWTKTLFACFCWMFSEWMELITEK